MHRVCFDKSAMGVTFLLVGLLFAAGVAAQSGMGSPGLSGGPGGGQPQPEPKQQRHQLPLFGPVEQIPVVDVKILGNKQVPTERIQSMILTRETRIYDPETIQRDVRKLMESRMFQDVRIFHRDVEGGKSITFQVVERPTMQYVRDIGNDKVKDKQLNKDLGLKAGDPLNRFTVEEARRRLEQLYRDKGFAEAHIEILEGTEAGDQGVVFQIHEGNVQRIYKVDFLGNQIASDSRLKTQIKSKPGLLWLLGGKAKTDEIDQDVDRLTAYYRSLGYFQARISRRIEHNEDHSWLTLQFVIDEGPRYRVRDVKVLGNEKYSSEFLMQLLTIQPGEYFNLAQLQRDLSAVRDHYGSQGHIMADIRGEPRFQEEPGLLDIVFKIDEGQQYRIGRILVNIDGENAHTRRTVVLNRLSLRPGDVVDMRELRNSERRLQASQLFMHNPASGVTPRIVVKPPELDDVQYADGPGRSIRGQSPTPHTSYRPTLTALADIVVHAVSNGSDAEEPQP